MMASGCVYGLRFFFIALAQNFALKSKILLTQKKFTVIMKKKLHKDIKMSKKVGRPDDKLRYINSVLNILDYSDGFDEDLKSGLNKLNAKEIVVLNCYLSKSLNYPLSSVLENIPLETPAQMNRCKIAIEHYNNLELKNANHTTEANEANETSKTSETVRPEGTIRSSTPAG